LLTNYPIAQFAAKYYADFQADRMAFVQYFYVCAPVSTATPLDYLGHSS
jgi:hypothetical protein